MVHEQVYPLLALGLEGLEKAKTLFVYRLVAHCVAVGLAIAAAVAMHNELPDLEIVAVAAACAAELAALYLHHTAMELHSRARQVMRRVMLLDALHPDEAPAMMDKARSHFGMQVRRKATALEERDQKEPDQAKRRLANYYWSPKPPGPQRLRDHLFESAIFSQHLYSAAWRFSLVCLVVLFGAAAVVLTFLVLHHVTTGTAEVSPHTPGVATLGIRILLALVAFLPACQELDHMLLYRMMEHHLEELLKRVEALYADSLTAGEPDFRLLAEFGDYSAATTFAPPIRTVVYKALADRLSHEFEAKTTALGQAKAPTPSKAP
jgi:hypothetical protein